MKLRNKKTGEIAEPFGLNCVNDRTFVQFDDGKGTFKFEAHSLAELNEEWEDYEEPKEYYWINYDGSISHAEEGTMSFKKQKSIGNYFETEEEAEKAVEKLKAWKRLKDKGFNFIGVKGLDYAIDFEVNPPYTHMTFDEYTATEEQKEFYNDLMLLFGGEE